jgi:hypothetical protein
LEEHTLAGEVGEERIFLTSYGGPEAMRLHRRHFHSTATAAGAVATKKKKKKKVVVVGGEAKKKKNN